jgi:NAD(P)H dehydrogenase (quinone)
MTIKLTICYHSGYGHTAKVASMVAQGAESIEGTDVKLVNVTEITESDWQRLDESNAIIFGCPTYMGGVSAKFKEFIDAASRKWMERKWENKIAAGFTNSGAYSGDKLNSLFQLVINATQHGMIWVGNSIMAGQGQGEEGPDSSQLNRVGSWLGLATQSNNLSADIAPPKGDLETAKLFGERIAKITHRFK